MSTYAVWIDHSYAYIYQFQLDHVDERTLKSDHSADHAKFYHRVADALSDAHEILVLGPGVAKDEFKHHCEKHNHRQVSTAIKGVKPFEAHPTKAMVLGESRDFFKHLHTWTKNY